MASRFSAIREFTERKAKEASARNSIEALTQRAQLKELGYDLNESKPVLGGLFGGGRYSMTPTPGFQSTKDLQRQKLENELDPNFEANKAAAKEKAILKARQEMFGGGMGAGTFGGGSQAGGNGQFIMTPDGKFVQNRNIPKPLNELQQAQLRDRERKEKEALQLKADQEQALRESAQQNLKTIGEVKKGVKYFGPMGNVPTIAAPSSLFGEYGERKNWETNVNKLLSQKVLDVISAMKQQSKTGATGFGAMNEKELQILQDAATALKKDLNPADAERYLGEIETIHRKFLGGGAEGNTETFGPPPDGAGEATEEDIQFTMQKYNMTREQVLKELASNG